MFAEGEKSRNLLQHFLSDDDCANHDNKKCLTHRTRFSFLVSVALMPLLRKIREAAGETISSSSHGSCLDLEVFPAATTRSSPKKREVKN